MPGQGKDVRVVLTADQFYPQTLRWPGRSLRVLHVERVYTAGRERRFRVCTMEGPYELGLHLGTGVWQVRRGPGWLDRARARLENMPRYPLPAGRRRRRPAAPRKPAPAVEGGVHANRLALVRR